MSAEASLWLRPDQEAYLRQEQGVQFYRQSKYEKAAELFMTGFNPDDLYNLGNALAQQQKIQEAIDTYQQVLDEVPDHEDARFNKEYLEKELEKQQEPPPPEEEKIEEQEPELYLRADFHLR